MLKDGNARICKKFTLPENIKKISFIHSPCVKFANLKHYKKILSATTKRNENEFELKKEKVCKNNYSSTCVVVCAIKKVRE